MARKLDRTFAPRLRRVDEDIDQVLALTGLISWVRDWTTSAGKPTAAIIALEKTPRGLEFDPNGNRLYITQAGSESVVVLDPSGTASSGKFR